MIAGSFGVSFAESYAVSSAQQVSLIEGRRYHLPTGWDRFLVDEAMLRRVMASLSEEFVEPIKARIVENLRAMTTWVVRKKGNRGEG
jgi:hypothetical protein